MNRPLLILLLVVASIVPPAAAQTITADFNGGAGEFTANFLQRGFTPWSYFTSGGIGNSGSIRGAGATSSAAIFDEGFANGAGAVFSLSVDFQVGNQSVSSSGEVLGLGLLSTSGFGWEGNQPGHAFHETVIRLSNTSGANLTQTRFIRGSGADSGVSGSYDSFSPMLTSGTWYRLTAIYTNTGADFGLSASLFDLGPTGLASPTLLRNVVTNAGSPALAAAPTVYIGLGGGTGGGEVLLANRLDNFSAVVTPVPEPSTLALLGGALAGLAWHGARRRAVRR